MAIEDRQKIAVVTYGGVVFNLFFTIIRQLLPKDSLQFDYGQKQTRRG